MFWVLEYGYVDDYLERRQPFRQAHLALAEATHRRHELLFGVRPWNVVVGHQDPPGASPPRAAP